MEFPTNKPVDTHSVSLQRAAVQGSVAILIGVISCAVARHFQFKATGWGVLIAAATVGISRFCYVARTTCAPKIVLDSKTPFDALTEQLPGKNRDARHYKLNDKNLTDSTLQEISQFIQNHPYPAESKGPIVQVLLHDNAQLKNVEPIIQIAQSVNRPVQLTVFNTAIDAAGIIKICQECTNIKSLCISAKQIDAKNDLIGYLQTRKMDLHISEWTDNCETLISRLEAQNSPLEVIFKNDKGNEIGQYPKPAAKPEVVKVVYGWTGATFLTQEDLDAQSSQGAAVVIHYQET